MKLSNFGTRIFLDRYAKKEKNPKDLKCNDRVVVRDDDQIRFGWVIANYGDKVKVQLDDAEVVANSFPTKSSGESIICNLSIIERILEPTPDETLYRVAEVAAKVEKLEAYYRNEFYEIMTEGYFVPGGRILAGAGVSGVSCYNCFVIPSPHDSKEGIFKTLNVMADTMSKGGGVGINISSLRPKNAATFTTNGRSSGSVSWGEIYSYCTGLIEQGGSRRGALMLILDVRHPDIMEFLTVKRDMARITNANISVAIPDSFMEAVVNNQEFELKYPDTQHEHYDSGWAGDYEAWEARGYPFIVYDIVKARDIWNVLVESAWQSAEPGVWFIDTAKNMHNGAYFEDLICTNPCGEIPLPAWGVCNLGNINLSMMVKDGEIQWSTLRHVVKSAVRFLDNIIDVTEYPNEHYETHQKQSRRIGLGTLGLAEMLMKLGIRYGSSASIDLIDTIYQDIAYTAYKTSCELALEKGAFPNWEYTSALDLPFIESPFIKRMAELPNLADMLKNYGMRNVTLLTQAPTGTVGTMLGTSTGIEPFYNLSWTRHSRLGDVEEAIPVYQEWLDNSTDDDILPDYIVTAQDITPLEHVQIQAAIQYWTDNSISKTCNFPERASQTDVGEVYLYMWRHKCKGGTIYRDKSRNIQVLDNEPVIEEAGKVMQRKSRPKKLDGSTYKESTPVGNVYITINTLDGQPFETFMTIGKIGTELAAIAEAIGRLVSLTLRMPSTLTPRERLEQIHEQLKDIGGTRAQGFGPMRVKSFIDGIARVLDNFLRGTKEIEADATIEYTQKSSKGDICPSCQNATFYHIEGCVKCETCGHSEC